jgi:hypothetical protein
VLIKPSPVGALLVGSMHGLAIFAVLIALPSAAAALCIVGVALSAVIQVSRALQLSPRSVHELTLRPDGRADWRDGSGQWHVAHRVNGAAFGPWLTVVGLRDPGKRLWPLLLVADAADPDALRELRVWLRWRAQSGTRARVT